MVRKIHDEIDARRCLRAAARAGQTAGEWARGHALDGRSLHAWKLALARRGDGSVSRRRGRAKTKPAHALVELVATPPTVAVGRYVLEVGDGRIEFGDDASAATLRRVVEVLRAC